jgi:hypothetical protein
MPPAPSTRQHSKKMWPGGPLKTPAPCDPARTYTTPKKVPPPHLRGKFRRLSDLAAFSGDGELPQFFRLPAIKTSLQKGDARIAKGIFPRAGDPRTSRKSGSPKISFGAGQSIARRRPITNSQALGNHGEPLKRTGQLRVQVLGQDGWQCSSVSALEWVR